MGGVRLIHQINSVFLLPIFFRLFDENWFFLWFLRYDFHFINLISIACLAFTLSPCVIVSVLIIRFYGFFAFTTYFQQIHPFSNVSAVQFLFWRSGPQKNRSLLSFIFFSLGGYFGRNGDCLFKLFRGRYVYIYTFHGECSLSIRILYFPIGSFFFSFALSFIFFFCISCFFC